MTSATKSALAKAAGILACLTVVSKVLGFIREASLAVSGQAKMVINGHEKSPKMVSR